MNPIKIYDLEFIEKKQEFDSVYTFRFKADEPLEFKAGQWVHLGFPLPNRDKSLVRHMSFASAPSDEFLEFTMDTSSGTAYKQKVSQLKPGERVKAFKVVGQFQALMQQNETIVFIAGGIGITPVRSIIRQLKHKQVALNWTLVHVARGPFLYDTEISQYDNKQMRTNREGLDPLWSEVIDQPVGTKYFISGSENFVKGISEKLFNSGISDDKLVVESFH